MPAPYRSPYVNFDLVSYFYSLLQQVPEGRVTTYGELAKALGDVTAARACGYMLSIVSNHDEIPSHRVIRSDFTIGKYSHPLGEQEKRRRLIGEGARISDGKVTEPRMMLAEEFETGHPLQKMREEQEMLSQRVITSDDYDASLLGAVDVSYDDLMGYACMDIYSGGEVIQREFVGKVKFPYIPGYLSYREHFFIEKLAKGFKGLLLIDGNGILHPRRIGLASFSGIMLDVPTIGVAKSLLLGKVENDWIFHNSQKLGYMLNKRAFISPGHRISLESSVKEIRKLSGNKYPEILRKVDRRTVHLRNAAGK